MFKSKCSLRYGRPLGNELQRERPFSLKCVSTPADHKGVLLRSSRVVVAPRKIYRGVNNAFLIVPLHIFQKYPFLLFWLLFVCVSVFPTRDLFCDHTLPGASGEKLLCKALPR